MATVPPCLQPRRSGNVISNGSAGFTISPYLIPHIVNTKLIVTALDPFLVLFDRLASPELLSLARRKNLIAKLKKLKNALHDIKGVLDDAEDRGWSRETAVISWLDDLRDFTYDVDDLLDEFATDEALCAAPAIFTCLAAALRF